MWKLQNAWSGDFMDNFWIQDGGQETMEPTTEIVSTSWHSYPKIFALGHRIIADLFKDDVIVEEKIDGSQFSFGVFDGELKCRSKSVVMNLLAPEKMFTLGIAMAQQVQDKLKPGWTYRGEFLRAPKHNTLAYERVPAGHFIGFDINTGHEHYMSYEEKAAEFARLGLETVPLLYQGKIEGYEMFRELLELTSCLGKQKIEGVVVKNYSRFGPDGRAMMGKFVSEEFKEIHNGDWKERNPRSGDFVERLIEKYCCPARWNKAIFRLRDSGKLENSPRDIGVLIKEIPDDIRAECEQDIRDELFKYAWEQISCGVTRGFPQFYKEQLAKSCFEPADENNAGKNYKDKHTGAKVSYATERLLRSFSKSR